MTLFMALETESKTTIPCATRVRFQALTVSLRLTRRLLLLLLLLLHEVENLVHSSCILLEEIYEFAILALRRLLNNSNRPTFATTRFGLIHCLDLQARLTASPSVFGPDSRSFIRISRSFNASINWSLARLHCVRIGSADETSQRTGEIWQLLVRYAMPSTKFRFV